MDWVVYWVTKSYILPRRGTVSGRIMPIFNTNLHIYITELCIKFKIDTSKRSQVIVRKPPNCAKNPPFWPADRTAGDADGPFSIPTFLLPSMISVPNLKKKTQSVLELSSGNHQIVPKTPPFGPPTERRWMQTAHLQYQPNFYHQWSVCQIWKR